ncbi:MAG: NADH-quinone oxidoreductase subunit A [Methanobacteriota archaeon]
MASPVFLDYVPLFLFVGLAILVVAGILGLTHLVGPKRPNRNKLSTYECGEDPIGPARGPVNVQYYLYVLVFLVIDVEIAFLLPWAVNFLDLGVAGVVEMVLFAGLILVGWAYAWRKGALEWST